MLSHPQKYHLHTAKLMLQLCLLTGFLGGSAVKTLPANAGDMGSIPGLGGPPGGGNGNPLQCPCLENPIDRGAWWATVQGGEKSWTQLKKLSTYVFNRPFQYSYHWGSFW